MVPGGLVEVPAGYRAGGWEVSTRIASGSWANVYEGRRVQPPRTPDDPALGLRAALKFLPGGALSPPQYADLQASVRHEVRFSEHADHPRLIRTFETFVVDDPGDAALHGSVVLAMERATGSLQDVLDAGTPPDPAPDEARVIREICQGLVHVHALGWVHGDLKPSNVLLMADGSVRLADFGLARELDGTHAYAPRLGSPDYLPPEWWSERICAQGIASRTTADIWALGVTAHRLLTGGMFPFPGASARARGAAAQAYAAGQGTLRLAGELPEQWRPLVADCLAPDHAARRSHTAATVLARVEALAAGGGLASASRRARSDAPRSSRRRAWTLKGRTRVTGAVLAVAAASTGGAIAATADETSAGRARVRVFNAQASCQHSRLASCRLGLVRDPNALYGPANVIGRAYHGDRLVTECYVPDGTLVTAENGASSTRWYRVRTSSATAWLPAVRAWPQTEPAVGRC